MFKAHMKNAFLNMDVCKNLYQGGYTHRNAQGLISGGRQMYVVQNYHIPPLQLMMMETLSCLPTLFV